MENMEHFEPEKISYSTSIEVVPGVWKRFATKGKVTGDPVMAALEARQFVEAFFIDHIIKPNPDGPAIQQKKLKPTPIKFPVTESIQQQYDKAVETNNTMMIKTLTDIYDFPDATKE